jgi:hypothetical protein
MTESSNGKLKNFTFFLIMEVILDRGHGGHLGSHQNIQCSTLHIPYTNSGNQMRLYTATEQIKIKKLFQMFSMIWFGLIDNIK